MGATWPNASVDPDEIASIVQARLRRGRRFGEVSDALGWPIGPLGHRTRGALFPGWLRQQQEARRRSLGRIARPPRDGGGRERLVELQAMACPQSDRNRVRRNPMTSRLERPRTVIGLERCAGAAGCSTRGGRRRAVDVCSHRPATMALVEEHANAHRRVIAQSRSALGERLWRRSRGAGCEGGRWPAMERALVLAGPERSLVLDESGRHRPGGDLRVAGHRWTAPRSALSPGERFIAHNAMHHATASPATFGGRMIPIGEFLPRDSRSPEMAKRHSWATSGCHHRHWRCSSPRVSGSLRAAMSRWPSSWASGPRDSAHRATSSSLRRGGS